MKTFLFFFALFINQLISGTTIERSFSDLPTSLGASLKGKISVKTSPNKETKITIQTSLPESQFDINMIFGFLNVNIKGGSDTSMETTILVPAGQLDAFTNNNDGDTEIVGDVFKDSFSVTTNANGNINLDVSKDVKSSSLSTVANGYVYANFNKDVESATLSTQANGNVYGNFKNIGKLSATTNAAGKVVAAGNKITTLDATGNAAGDISLCSFQIENPVTGSLTSSGDLYVNENADTSTVSIKGSGVVQKTSSCENPSSSPSDNSFSTAITPSVSCFICLLLVIYNMI